MTSDTSSSSSSDNQRQQQQPNGTQQQQQPQQQHQQQQQQRNDTHNNSNTTRAAAAVTNTNTKRRRGGAGPRVWSDGSNNGVGTAVSHHNITYDAQTCVSDANDVPTLHPSSNPQAASLSGKPVNIENRLIGGVVIPGRDWCYSSRSNTDSSCSEHSESSSSVTTKSTSSSQPRGENRPQILLGLGVRDDAGDDDHNGDEEPAAAVVESSDGETHMMNKQKRDDDDDDDHHYDNPAREQVRRRFGVLIGICSGDVAWVRWDSHGGTVERYRAGCDDAFDLQYL